MSRLHLSHRWTAWQSLAEVKTPRGARRVIEERWCIRCDKSALRIRSLPEKENQ